MANDYSPLPMLGIAYIKARKPSFPCRRESIAPQAMLIIQTVDSRFHGDDEIKEWG
jgi:hypothetical protein